MARDWCSGSDQPHCGDRCTDCGRKHNTQHQTIVVGGMARKHVALSSRQKEGRDGHRG